MKALSIKQPWAWLICKGFKDIENRGSHLSRYIGLKELPSRIYVHHGKRWDAIHAREIFSLLKKAHAELTYEELLQWWGPECNRTDGMFGEIIGEVDITGCVEKSDSPWFVGKYGFTLATPVLYDKPIPCKGKLGFFEPEI